MVSSHGPPPVDLACNPGLCPDWESNQQPFALQSGSQLSPLSHTSQDDELRFCLSPFGSSLAADDKLYYGPIIQIDHNIQMFLAHDENVNSSHVASCENDFFVGEHLLFL